MFEVKLDGRGALARALSPSGRHEQSSNYTRHHGTSRTFSNSTILTLKLLYWRSLLLYSIASVVRSTHFTPRSLTVLESRKQPKAGGYIMLRQLALTLILLTACATVALAQESKCSLKLAELPAAAELRGFRVGMTIEQVKARLPKLQLRPADEFGFTSHNIFPDYEQGIDKASFVGVRTVSLDFLDGRVFSIWIGYDKSFKWQTLDEFVSGMTSVLKLPNSWRSKFRTRLLDCSDFTVAVIPVGDTPSIKISDNAAKELLDKRQAAKEEAQP
jgi:hypothetical protein